MKRTIGYEWDLEEFDPETDDVLDHDHSDRLAGVRRPTEFENLVLVRDTWEDETDLKNRQWAYVQNGALPAEFDGGAKIPERFRRELAQHAERLGLVKS